MVGVSGQLPRTEITPRWRVGAQAVIGSRATTTRPGFLGQTERGKTRRRRGAGTVGGAGGERRSEVVGVVGAFGAAIHTALHATIGHRRHIGLAQADGPGSTQPFDGEGIALGDQVLERWAAGSGRQALDQVAVLGGVGNTVQWAQGFAASATGIGGFGLFQRIRIAHHHSVELGGRVRAVIGVDPCKISLDQFDRRGTAGLERSAQLGDGDFGYLEHAVTLSLIHI